MYYTLTETVEYTFDLNLLKWYNLTHADDFNLSAGI